MAEVSASGAVERSLAAIAKDNDRLRAIIHLDPDGARASAATIDASASPGPLRGLTFVAKDLIDVAGMPTTGGSRLFDMAPAARSAAVIRDLEAAGAVVVGKSNMHELAVGGARNPWFGQVVNPLSAAHGTGGTSSGSVAAVAAGFVDFALGTDSGGSNRSTAAATGLFGFKPTNGTLSLEGILPIAPTMDTVGLLARDGTTLLEAFAALTHESPPEVVELGGRVFARPIGLHGPVDSTIDSAIELAADTARALGGTIAEVEFTEAPALAAAGRTILRYEFFRHHGSAIRKRPERVGSDVHAFIEVAAKVSGAEYEDALSLVLAHREHWLHQMRGTDALLLPAVPGLAPRLEDEHTNVNGTWVPYGPAGAELRMWANTIGLPAVTVPVARPGKRPASIQLAGHRQSDALLLGLAAALGDAIRHESAALLDGGRRASDAGRVA